jgi:formate hydrogenlyase regulatory protein HycA
VAVPTLIPIAHEAYRTETIGRYRDGQFFAKILKAGRPNGWYVYLHLFDHDGNYVSSDITVVGEADVLRGEMEERAERKLAELVTGLPEREFGDIAIRLFEVDHDGVRFALVDESEPERGDWVELYPERYGFHEPWDGLFDT